MLSEVYSHIIIYYVYTARRHGSRESPWDIWHIFFFHRLIRGYRWEVRVEMEYDLTWINDGRVSTQRADVN